jgi:16S rRNA C967 or C1407 C5-methylase (RsmB/RsmF family)/NOL1/NOP2/fmu family ribosome biogenesis protein
LTTQNFPSAFVNRIKQQFAQEHDALLSSLEQEPKTSIHLNDEKLGAAFSNATAVPWYDKGVMLSERPSFTLNPLFHAGCFYPQESSSMFLYQALSQALTQKENLRVLDLCASPGGKSIVISSFLKNNGVLISNEVIKQRNAVLRENLTKWGSTNNIVTCNDPKQFSTLYNYFDCIVVDAPCSGEGMFRKDHKARTEWSESNVQLCSARQQRIIDDVLPALKKDGYLIYSTCTFAPEENEWNCKQWIENGELECVPLNIQNNWNIHTINSNGVIAYQFLPHRVSGEGFFLSVFKKKNKSLDKWNTRKVKDIFALAPKKEIQILPEWIKIENKELIKTQQNNLFVSPLPLEELNQLCNALYITMPGVELGQFMYQDFIPAHALALSPYINGLDNRIELSEQESLNYLRGDAIHTDKPLGWSVVSYLGHSLGWVKVLNGRVNNYYPKEWRIRMR